MSDCTCHAPADAEPEDHDADCPENPSTESGCGWEWDHTVPVGQTFCSECGAEIEEG